MHVGGDNLIVGSFDRKVCWFDADMSSTPYKTLRHHPKAIRAVAFHESYPLFASGGEEGTVVVSHGKVFRYMIFFICLSFITKFIYFPRKIATTHKIL